MVGEKSRATPLDEGRSMRGRARRRPSPVPKSKIRRASRDTNVRSAASPSVRRGMRSALARYFSACSAVEYSLRGWLFIILVLSRRPNSRDVPMTESVCQSHENFTFLNGVNQHELSPTTHMRRYLITVIFLCTAWLLLPGSVPAATKLSPPTIKFEPAGGVFTNTVPLRMASSTPGAIHITVDGSEPT